ncbi:MAG TPA: acetyl-CoA C-acetyltransferase [Thiotrichaceae bacterium]|jgi:acetyl-CoA C-acetyltransferase|nr:acetyl-CoA C-acetyltransferase [Thiotrichaceae bacterium]HIM07753.1 acetyl-CoA C-acetyltransferase [Gammaproteobacteria bacterium]
MTTRKPKKRPVYIVDGARSPFLRARGRPGKFVAADLALKSAQPLMLRQPFEAEQLDEVILGCVMPAPTEANIARIVSLRLGCGDHVPAWTVQRNCGSGMQAVDSAFRNIADGDSEIILAGGVEAMSHAPIMLNSQMVNFLSDLNMARSIPKKLAVLSSLRPGHLKPVIALILGLTDSVVGLSMGRTAEILAHRFDISREEMDAYAARSHQRLAAAHESGNMDEIEVIYDEKGNIYDTDDGVRPDSNPEALAKLRAVFDRQHGLVTAGNSAQVSDGASWLLLASEAAVEKHQLQPLGRIVDCTWVGLSPSQMGLGPAYASSALMKNNKLDIAEIDYWEINEAFATQVLACERAMADKEFCKNELGRRNEIGEIEAERLNIDGGGISLGHPVGASGARIVFHLLKTLQRTNTQRGIASLCIGGGQGGAMLLENINV